MKNIASTNKTRKRLFIVSLSILISVIVVIGSYMVYRHSASAAPVVGFNPGRIMDDAVFTDKNTMNPQQIQGFLNNKNPNCDTAGLQRSEMSNSGVPDYNGDGVIQRWEWGQAKHGQTTFPCMKDYVENGKSAAQIIFEVSQEFSINPQVLIVLLQKEQSLVTDTWPIAIQYKTATGYGCPDTAPCASQYFGLTNQLRWSGRMFRAIMNATPTWYTPYILGWNNIQYSPDSSCGGSMVNIENRATQALYNYTPYQPNQAALNAGWGSASCGAYGNRNFYLYFTEWFGSTSYHFGNIPSNTSPNARAECKAAIGQNEVARLYQPDSRDFLYTSSSIEACVAISYGYIWDGVVFKSASPSTVNAVPVYRIADSVRHVFTTSIQVRNDMIANASYKDEGIAFYVYSSNGQGRIPVSGLQTADTFFITSSGREAVYYQNSLGYYNFGTIFYTDPLETTQTSVHRLSKNNSRLYTTSSIEQQQAVSNHGFIDEGIVSKNDRAPNTDNLPVYRIRSPSGAYFYTTNRIERDAAVINNGYYSEGIAFYSLLWSNSPVFRSSNYSNGLKIFTNSQLEYELSSARHGYSLEGHAWYSY